MIAKLSALLSATHTHSLFCFRIKMQYIPGLDELGDREECAKYEAEPSHHNVSYSKERVPSSHHRPCGDED